MDRKRIWKEEQRERERKDEQGGDSRYESEGCKCKRQKKEGMEGGKIRREKECRKHRGNKTEVERGRGGKKTREEETGRERGIKRRERDES